MTAILMESELCGRPAAQAAGCKVSLAGLFQHICPAYEI